MTTPTVSVSPTRWRGVTATFAFVVALLAIVYWGGIPAVNQMGFALGVASVILVLAIIGGLAWHLLVRPIPKAPRQTRMFSALQHRLIAWVLLLNSACLIVGAFWDEVWHRRYGLPFGEDFFWRPHLMMYFGMLLTIALAFYGLLTLNRTVRGTFQQRFRANPSAGLLVLTGLFWVYALPADPVWHALYGVDLTAWSLPHVMIAFSFIMIAVLSSTLYIISQASTDWRTLRALRLGDWIPLSALVFSMMILMQLLTTEWEGVQTLPLVLNRPDWLLPLVLVVGSTFTATLATRSLKMIGASSLVLVGAWALRVGMIALFDAPDVSAGGWVASAVPAVVMDVIALGWFARYKQPLALMPHVIILSVLHLVSILPLTLMLYPVMNPTAGFFIGSVIAIPLGTLWAVWVGGALGDQIAQQKRVTETTAQEAENWVRVLMPIAGVAMLVFGVWFILTATPPVL